VRRYNVIFGPLAQAAVPKLPKDAVLALKERMGELAEDPSQMYQGPRPHQRNAVFGANGEGMIFATVHDGHQVIIVDEVVWAG
jgi:hypothetical protein